MNFLSGGTRQSTWRMLTAIFAVAVAVNYVWELAQTPLYQEMNDFSRMLWHCFVAALGDGLLVLLIFGLGWLVLGRQDWFVRPGLRGYALMLLAGLVIAVLIEWVLVRILEQWSYSERLPVVPLLGVGLSAVAQMLLLPPLIFYIVARRGVPAWPHRKQRRRQ